MLDNISLEGRIAQGLLDNEPENSDGQILKNIHDLGYSVGTSYGTGKIVVAEVVEAGAVEGAEGVVTEAAGAITASTEAEALGGAIT